MKWPGRWSSEYFDYKETELKQNNGIYDRMNEAQIQAVKSYFRWRTKARFSELCKNTSLKAKPKKAELLSTIMGNATDWVYDGCVDTGYVGGGHCELGHALRYEHYAYSPSINKQIIFGVTCAADFFGIEPERLRKISKVQNDILEEIKEIVFIKDTGKQERYQQFYYGDLPKIVGMFRSNLDEVFGAGWNATMGKFLECNLPLTRSMVDRIYFIRKRVYEPKVAELQKSSLESQLFENDPAKKDFYANGHLSELYYVVESLNYIENRPNNTEHDLVCNKFVLNQAMNFRDTYRHLNSIGIADFKKFVFSGKTTEVFIHANNGDRKATEKERKEMPSEAFTKEVYLLPEAKYRMLCIFGWGIFGYNKLYNESKCESKPSESSTIRIEKSAKLMKRALNWLNSSDFEADMKNLKQAIDSSNTYPTSAPDEISLGDTDSFHDMAIYILDNCPRGTKMKLLEIAIDISDRFINSGSTFNISDKQKQMVRKAYDYLTHKGKSGSKIAEKAEYVLENISPALSAEYDFEIKVCQTVARTGKATDKQAARVNKVYDALKSDGIGENTSTEVAQHVFIDEPEDGVSPLGFRFKQFNGDESSVFAEDSTKYSDTGRDYEYESIANTGSILNIPTVVEISTALGLGQFKVEGGIYGE